MDNVEIGSYPNQEAEGLIWVALLEMLLENHFALFFFELEQGFPLTSGCGHIARDQIGHKFGTWSMNTSEP
jgi:hypothetical protein